MREGGIAIIAHPLIAKFDRARFASYVEFYEKLLTQEHDPYWLWENHVEDFAHRPEYIYGYRHKYAYHGAHPFFMWNSTLIPKRYLSGIFFAGVKDFDAAERCGFRAFATVEEAIEAAQVELGRGREYFVAQTSADVHSKSFVEATGLEHGLVQDHAEARSVQWREIAVDDAWLVQPKFVSRVLPSFGVRLGKVFTVRGRDDVQAPNLAAAVRHDGYVVLPCDIENPKRLGDASAPRDIGLPDIERAPALAICANPKRVNSCSPPAMLIG